MDLITKKTLLIDADWCKGCAICVSTCPKDVLEIKCDLVSVKDMDKCIYCKLCEMRCPDYAIYIEGDEENGS